MPREVAESSDQVEGLKGLVGTGSSVLIEGTMVAAPEGKEQVCLRAQALPSHCSLAVQCLGQAGPSSPAASCVDRKPRRG